MNETPPDRPPLAGRYRLERLIAAGGMGQVWLATDETLGRDVAVKLLNADASRDEVFAHRFRQEARALARLSHPAIVAVHDFGDDEGDPYLVMEYVAGRTVADLLRDEGRVSPKVARGILAHAAAALAVAHAAGIVHRDVKPGNILLTPDGAAKLTDFGIARLVEGAGLTRTGEVLGTPQYLSPEQARGAGADAASDIYALGLVGFELLSGTKAFDRSTPVATALAQINEPVPPLPSSVPPDLAAVIRQCLCKEPAGRPESAEWLAATLAGLDLAGPDLPAPDLPTSPPAEPELTARPRGLAAAHPEHPTDTAVAARVGPAAFDVGGWQGAALVSLLVLLLLVAVVFLGR